MWSTDPPLEEDGSDFSLVTVRVRQGRNVGFLGCFGHRVAVRLALGNLTCHSPARIINCDADFNWVDLFYFRLVHPPRTALPPPQVLKMEVVKQPLSGDDVVLAQGSFVVMPALSSSMDTWMPLCGTNDQPLPVCVRLNIKVGGSQEASGCISPAPYLLTPRASPSKSPTEAPPISHEPYRSRRFQSDNTASASPSNPLPLGNSPRHRNSSPQDTRDLPKRAIERYHSMQGQQSSPPKNQLLAPRPTEALPRYDDGLGDESPPVELNELASPAAEVCMKATPNPNEAPQVKENVSPPVSAGGSPLRLRTPPPPAVPPQRALKTHSQTDNQRAQSTGPVSSVTGPVPLELGLSPTQTPRDDSTNGPKDDGIRVPSPPPQLSDPPVQKPFRLQVSLDMDRPLSVESYNTTPTTGSQNDSIQSDQDILVAEPCLPPLVTIPSVVPPKAPPRTSPFRQAFPKSTTSPSQPHSAVAEDNGGPLPPSASQHPSSQPNSICHEPETNASSTTFSVNGMQLKHLKNIDHAAGAPVCVVDSGTPRVGDTQSVPNLAKHSVSPEAPLARLGSIGQEIFAPYAEMRQFKETLAVPSPHASASDLRCQQEYNSSSPKHVGIPRPRSPNSPVTASSTAERLRHNSDFQFSSRECSQDMLPEGSTVIFDLQGSGSWGRASEHGSMRRNVSKLIEGFQLRNVDLNYNAWDTPKRQASNANLQLSAESMANSVDLLGLDSGATNAEADMKRKVSFVSPPKHRPRDRSPKMDFLIQRGSSLRRSSCLSAEFYDRIKAESDPRGALIEIRTMLRQAETAGEPHGQMYANIWCGTVAFMLHQRTDAMAAYQAASEVARTLGDTTVQIHLLAALGDLCRANNDLPAALESYTTALKEAESLQDLEVICGLCSQLGQLHTLLEDYVTALSFHTRELQAAQALDHRELVCQAHGDMAIALFGLGDLHRARHSFEFAFSGARCLDASIGWQARRHLSYWGYTFERLLLAEGWTSEALAIAEERRTVPYLPGLIWRAQKEVARMRVLGSAPVSIADDTISLLLDNEYTFSPQDIQATAEESGITFLIYSIDRESSRVGRPTFVVWVVTSKGTIHCRQLPSEYFPMENELWQDAVNINHVGLPRLSRQPPAHVKAPVILLSTRVATAQQLSQHLQTQLAQLYDALIAPIEKWLPSKEETLGIIPDGPLWGIPWSGLFSPLHGYLIERYNIFCVPSMRCFQLLRLLKQIRSYLDSGTGYLVGPEMDMPLDHLAKEGNKELYVQNIMWPHSSRTPATEASVRAALERCSLIHFECHALGEYQSEWRHHRGALILNQGEQLRAHDVAKLDLPTMLAVLSCQATYGRTIGEGAMDLPRTLLSSGTCAVLGCYWPNHLPSTVPQVLLDFYLICGNKEPDRARALRQAVLRSLRTEHTKSPLLWARFFLYGVP